MAIQQDENMFTTQQASGDALVYAKNRHIAQFVGICEQLAGRFLTFSAAKSDSLAVHDSSSSYGKLMTVRLPASFDALLVTSSL